MKKKFYNKLIRDHVPGTMRRKGVAFKATRLNLKKFKRELLKKVGEEASSLPRLTTNQDIAEELGDTLDVIAEIQRVFKIPKRQVDRARRAAAKKKGGFARRLFLHWSADDGYRTNERTYKRR